jgi:hypothetical protein
VLHGNAGAADHWFPAHDLRIDLDSVVTLHTYPS